MHFDSLIDDSTVEIKARFLCPDAIFVSSKSGIGLDSLLSAIEEIIFEHTPSKLYLVPHNQYSLVSKMRREGCLEEMESNEDGMLVNASPSPKLAKEMEKFALKA